MPGSRESWADHLLDQVLSGPFYELPPVGYNATTVGHINKTFQRYLESAFSFALVDYIPPQVLESHVEQVKTSGSSPSMVYLLRSIMTGGLQPTRSDFVPIASDTGGNSDSDSDGDGLASFAVPLSNLIETGYQRLHKSCSIYTSAAWSKVARRMTYYFGNVFVYHTVEKGGRLGYITHSIDLELTDDEAEAMVANWQQSLMHRQIDEICHGVTDEATPEDIMQLEEDVNAEFNMSVADWCCEHGEPYGPMNPEDSMEEDDPVDSIE